ncbi:cyclase/dehydrase, partial [Chytriomyces cf. hyalinus JEL632]
MFPSLLKTHSQSVTLGYSQRQLFAMVSDIGKYEQFVPWCVSSRILEARTLESGSKTVSRMKAQLGVGFKQFNERYSSNVECTHSNDIRAVASDSSLFKTLNTTWTLRPATHLSPDTNWKKPTASKDHPICTLDFYIAFEFKSILYAQVSELFFNQVSLEMVDSFVKRARTVYGEPCPFRK